VDGQGLTQGERRALKAIEDRLRLDAAGLDRRLREMTLGPWGRLSELAGRPLALVAALLGLASAVLLVVAVRGAGLGVVWAFAVCWTGTLLTTAAVSRARRRGIPLPRPRPIPPATRA
jgi:hypothetical protein